MIVIVFGIFGLIVGSFLNVVIQRFGTGVSLGGRSACDFCGMQLRWYHLIPVLSWVVLKGRCAGCGSRLSVQYPLVELLTAFVFAVVGSTGLPLLSMGIALVMFSLLIALSVYDVHHTIIPDKWVYGFAALALLFSATLTPGTNGMEWLLLVAAGPAAALPLFALWFVSKGRVMGLGDVKLALGMGWLLGPYWGIVSVFGGFIIGAIVSVCILIPLPYILRLFALHRFPYEGTQRGFTMKSEVPFGPFLTCSCFLIWYLHYALAIAPLVLN